EFNSNDAILLISQMVQIKIKYHENKINILSNEEDIKSREAKIKRLQKELFDLREHISSKNNNVKLESLIKIG
ncbi:MAG TPA: hypothetical protein PK076_08360, partial [Saprospiraceae bacterium]|nr:hypothetical protein [Saprospiraceae bacterium]